MLSLVKMIAGSLSGTGNKDPAPGRENKGTGIPEMRCSRTVLPLPKENGLVLPVKNMRTGIPS